MSDFNFYDILKYILPQLGILIVVVIFLEHWLRRDRVLQDRRRRDEFNQHILPNQIHAFERMVLFMERISPNSLIPRMNDASLTAKEFQYILTNEIANEFQHNLSQQLYIPTKTWNLISLTKDQMIQEIIQATSSLGEKAMAKDLAYKIIENNISNGDKIQTSEAIQALKKDLYSMVQ